MKTATSMLRWYIALAMCVGLLLCACAGAFAQENQTTIACDCRTKVCSCYLQPGDAGGAMRAVIQVLRERGYLSDQRTKVTYTAHVLRAVEQFQRENDLPENGLLDDATLTLLLWQGEEVEKSDERIAWVSSNSGEKYHLKKACSGMKNPRKMVMHNAVKLQMEPCKHCAK